MPSKAKKIQMKKQVAIIYGGKSTEHQISILSCINIYNEIDRKKYEISLIYIDQKGNWFLSEEKELIEKRNAPMSEKALLMLLNSEEAHFCFACNPSQKLRFDVIFPVLHGPNGEDGTIQGMLEMLGVAYVGPGVLSSAACMDKDLAKRLFREAGIDVARSFCFKKHEKNKISYSEIRSKLGEKLVIKPACSGSSVGISKAENETELHAAIEKAFAFDTKILVEEYVEGREIECAVMGNEKPIAAIPGEIVTEFYDYEAKYLSESKARLDAPADLPESIIEKVQETALLAYKTMECEGMARVDFFLSKNKLILNEINTIPGFTNISMYPKLFEISGISNKELISKLIELAMERKKAKEALKISYGDTI
jgi:D-alanine-D-alanine ligase